jgi:hypothetical protein
MHETILSTNILTIFRQMRGEGSLVQALGGDTDFGVSSHGASGLRVARIRSKFPERR